MAETFVCRLFKEAYTPCDNILFLHTRFIAGFSCDLIMVTKMAVLTLNV